MFLDQLKTGKDLTFNDACLLAEWLMATDDMPAVGECLRALQHKGVCPDELQGFVAVLQKTMVTLDVGRPVMDLVGTGGDGANTVNISTAASIVVASCGVDVIKHGNRSVSSQCGSADFLESCGVIIDCSLAVIKQCLAQCHIGFCYAPQFHPVMAHLKKLRKMLGVPTILNILGPLLNPAKPAYGIFGVYDPALLPLYAEVLQRQGIQHAMVVHGSGLDELNTLGPVEVIEIHQGQQTAMTIDPVALGFNLCRLSDLQGGDAQVNQQLLLSALHGNPSPIRDTISLNAGVALYLSGQVTAISDGVQLAIESLQSAKPANTLAQWVACSQESKDA